MFVGLHVVPPALAEARMLAELAGRSLGCGRDRMRHALHLHERRLVHAQRQTVAVHQKLHGVAHGGISDEGHLRTGNDPHIQEVLAQGARPSHIDHNRAVTNLKRRQRLNPFTCHDVSPVSMPRSPCGLVEI